MPTPRVAPQATVFSNEIYVLGGYDRKGPRGAFRHKKNVEMYDTACVARPHPYPVHQKNRNVIYCFMSRKTLYSKLFDSLFAST